MIYFNKKIRDGLFFFHPAFQAFWKRYLSRGDFFDFDDEVQES